MATAGISALLLGEAGKPLPHGRQEGRQEWQLAPASGRENFQAIVHGSPCKPGHAGTWPTSTVCCLLETQVRCLLESKLCWSAECRNFPEVAGAGDWVPLMEHPTLSGNDVVVGALLPTLACKVPAAATRVAWP